MTTRALLALVGAFVVAGTARADDAACVAASEQSLTLRKEDKLHDTLKQLATCADPSCPAEVREECTRRIDEVNAAMPTIIFGAKDGAGNDREQATVTVDGKKLTTALDGRAVAIDPGEHTLRFEAPGEKPVEKTIVVREGEKDRREIVVIGAPPPQTPTAPARAPSAWNAQRVLGLGAMGLGVAGVGLGAYFGAFAISAKNQEGSDCPAAGCAHYLQSKADYDTAQTDALASTIAFIAGGVLAATGVVLWFTAPRVHIAPTTSAHGAGLSISGEF